jgi:hypothetical protein
MSDHSELAQRLADLAHDYRVRPELKVKVQQRTRRRQLNRRRLLAVGAAAVMGLVAVTATTMRNGGSDDEQAVRADGDTAPTDVGHWSTVAAAPLQGRSSPAVVWTGTEVLVFGGKSGRADGAAWNPATNTWRLMSDAPTAGGQYTVAVWSGSEMLLWGRVHGPNEPAGPQDGLAYNPVQDSWRTLPAGPVPSLPYAAGVWTGSELIVWGGQAFDSDGRSTGSSDGALYDPSRDSWRPLEPPPLQGRYYQQAVWDGERMIVWGGANGDGGEPGIFDGGAAYDPRTGTWQTMRGYGDGGRLDETVAWTGDALLVWGGFGPGGDPVYDGATYDHVNEWIPLNDPPASLRPDEPERQESAWAGHELLVWGDPSGHREAWSWSPVTRRWSQLPDSPVPGRYAFGSVWTGEQLFIWGGEAGGDVGVLWTPPPTEAVSVDAVATDDRGCPVPTPLDLTAGDETAVRSVTLDTLRREGHDDAEIVRIYPAEAPTPPNRAYAAVPIDQCGAAIGDRTWVVEVRLPEYEPSRSLADVQYFVSRFDQGWRIWGSY